MVLKIEKKFVILDNTFTMENSNRSSHYNNI